MYDLDKPLPTATSRYPWITKLVTGTVLANCCIYALVGIHLFNSWQEHEDVAATTAQNLAVVLEHDITSIFAKADLAVRSVEDEAVRHLAAGAIDQQRLDTTIARQMARVPELHNLRMSDARGDLLYGAKNERETRINVADREYFRKTQDTHDAGLIINRPSLGRVTGKWVINLVRRVNRPDGSFGGVVIGSLSVEYLTRLFSGIDVGPHGVVLLRDNDHSLVVRHPVATAPNGGIGTMSTMKEYLEVMRSGKSAVTFTGTSSLDGATRIYALRRLPGLPYNVMAGLATSDYRVAWFREAVLLAGLTLLFTIVSIIYSRLLAQKWRREVVIKAELEHQVAVRTAALRTSSEQLQVELVERKKIEEVLTFLAQTAAEQGGEDFFRHLARYLATSLEMEFVCIDVLEEENLSARTMAMYVDGVFEDNVSYTLADTPCGEVVANRVCCYRDGVRHHFLKDQVLQDMLAESYVGTILWSGDGSPIGLIAVIGRRPLADPEVAQKILQVVGVRAAAELERIISEQNLLSMVESLKLVTERLNLAQRAARFGVWDWNIITGDIVWSPEMFHLFGLDPVTTTASFETWRGVVHLDDREAAGHKIEAALRERSLLMSEYRIITPDQQIRWISASGEASYDDAGRPLRMIGICVDITDRKLAEEILKSRDEQFRMMFEHHDSVMLLIDPETGAIIDANSAAARFYGYDVATLRTIKISDINVLGPDELEADRLRALHEERNTFIFPHRIAGGEIRMVEVNSSPITLKGQTILFSIIHDITRRIRAEAQLQKTLAELTRSNEELQQFAYVASHDLREPLRMVASYTQLLARRYDDQLDDEARKFIAYAVEGATRMQRLIDDLLTYSRVETKGRSLESAPTGELLDAAVHNLQAAIEESGAVVTCDELPTVRADRSQLIQLFQNLVGNAIKFRHPGASPRIHVTARNLGQEWQFSVADNGIGIDPRFNERIFVIFQRLHAREQYTGTGIGLAICKRIVDRHGGRIWVKSTPGQGATFCFTLEPPPGGPPPGYHPPAPS